jgi:toll-interacting protein
VDERIAWGLVQIKEEVLSGETLDDWYSLSGKQGDEKEGMINLVFAYRVRKDSY